MSLTTRGIHHVTAIGGAPQSNVDFYCQHLGLRLVKRTVNFDDPGTYHLYYGDETGQPGSLLTFFPLEDAVAARFGAGMTAATAFSVPEGALDYWIECFEEKDVAFEGPSRRFGQQVIQFEDPDGLPLELVAHPSGGARTGWKEGPMPTGYAIRSLYGVTLSVQDPEPTARLLTETMGFEAAGEEDGRWRFCIPNEGLAVVVDLVRSPQEAGRMGKGAIHHVAFRARDEEEQIAWKEAVADLGFQVTGVKDRQYFKSVYFREPGGVLFEIATDGPGFLIDEDAAALGEALKLPGWLEGRRNVLEQQLPPLELREFT